MNRWLAGHVFWPLTERLRRRDTMRRWRQLERCQTLSADELRELQARKLRRLLRIANDHCPFHARRFLQAGLDPADPNLDLDDLRRLPLLTRDDIRDHLDELTWHGCPGGGPQSHNTGGSSGEPLKFHFDPFRQAADWAARWRARGWWNVRPGDPEIVLWGAPIELRRQDRLRAWRDGLLNQHMLNAFDMSLSTMDAYLAHIRDMRPVCLFGYASSLALLARHGLDRGLGEGTLGGDRLRAVFATGEVLLDPDREAIGRAFGVPAIIEYGARDGGLLACECPAGRLHVPEENVIVEVLDGEGCPAAPGGVGAITVTHLETPSMPLIRYRIGDVGERADDSPCPCGLAHASLRSVRGRSTDQIVRRTDAGLARMHALSLMYVVREAEGIRQFRITQPSLDLLDVEVVSDNRFTPQAQHAMQLGLQQRMGENVIIRIHSRDHLEPSPSGKHACVVSHVA